MTIYTEIEKKLEEHKAFRERRFRGTGLVILTLRSLGLAHKYDAGMKLSIEELISFANRYDSYRHEYDAVLRERKDLRGQDYEDKDKYEQAKQAEFGYYPGYNEDIKSLKALV